MTHNSVLLLKILTCVWFLVPGNASCRLAAPPFSTRKITRYFCRKKVLCYLTVSTHSMFNFSAQCTNDLRVFLKHSVKCFVHFMRFVQFGGENSGMFMRPSKRWSGVASLLDCDSVACLFRDKCHYRKENRGIESELSLPLFLPFSFGCLYFLAQDCRLFAEPYRLSHLPLGRPRLFVMKCSS